jgi:histidine phosphotransfer protein HptB
MPGPMNASVSPASEPPPRPALDPLTLARLQELDPEGRTGVVVRVLKTYHGALGASLGQFASAVAASDVDEVRRAAHKLKSSSASVGALALSRLCGQVEQQSLGVWSDAVPPLVDALLAEGRRVQSALHTLLEEQGPR